MGDYILNSRLPKIMFEGDVYTGKAHVIRTEVALALAGFAEHSRTGRDQMLSAGLPSKTDMLLPRDDQTCLSGFDLSRKVITCAKVELQIFLVGVSRRWTFSSIHVYVIPHYNAPKERTSMPKYIFLLFVLTAYAFAQDTKPQVTAKKMTDAEYQRLNDTGDAMQKAADAYRKAADNYEKAKEEILGKYDALDSQDSCGGMQKIVDIRGPNVIVELRSPPYYTMNGIAVGECVGFIATPYVLGSR